MLPPVKTKTMMRLSGGIQRRRVVTLNDGEPGETSISVACMHCSDAPCMAVCPADCFEQTEDGIVRHNKDLCIGCGYCLFACPFGAPQFPKQGAFAERGKMDKCTFCAGGPGVEPGSHEEKQKYGSNRIAEGKLPMCASLCSTKALLAVMRLKCPTSTVIVLLLVVPKKPVGRVLMILPMMQARYARPNHRGKSSVLMH